MRKPDYITINSGKKNEDGRRNVWLANNFDVIPFIDVKKGDFFIVGGAGTYSRDISEGCLRKITPASSIVVDTQSRRCGGNSGSNMKKVSENGQLSYKVINLTVPTFVIPSVDVPTFEEEGINLLAFPSQEAWNEVEKRITGSYYEAEHFRSAVGDNLHGILVFGDQPTAKVNILYLSPMAVVQADTLRNVKVLENQIPIINVGKSTTANLTLNFRGN